MGIMIEVRTIGLDLAKNVFQVHGADASGAVVFRKQLRRGQVLKFFGGLPRCLVAMEACGSSHFWAREIGGLGHEVRMIPPAYVKPFLKRQKNDAADAEAICEAAQRPTMRFVAVKSEETQGVAVVLRSRDLLIRQRTQTINALRGHLAEFGKVAPQGSTYASKLITMIEDPQTALPETARTALRFLAAVLSQLNEQIRALDAQIVRRAREDETARRLMTIPGVGPLICHRTGGSGAIA
jgi:transposase